MKTIAAFLVVALLPLASFAATPEQEQAFSEYLSLVKLFPDLNVHGSQLRNEMDRVGHELQAKNDPAANSPRVVLIAALLAIRNLGLLQPQTQSPVARGAQPGTQRDNTRRLQQLEDQRLNDARNRGELYIH